MAVLVDSPNDINSAKVVLYFVQDEMFLFLVLFWMSLISLTFAYLCFVIMSTVVLYCFFPVAWAGGPGSIEFFSSRLTLSVEFLRSMSVQSAVLQYTPPLHNQKASLLFL